MAKSAKRGKTPPVRTGGVPSYAAINLKRPTQIHVAAIASI
jgi:hypothetical protein